MGAKSSGKNRHFCSPPGGVFNKHLDQRPRMVAAEWRGLGTKGADAADAHGRAVECSRQIIQLGTCEDIPSLGESVRALATTPEGGSCPRLVQPTIRAAFEPVGKHPMPGIENAIERRPL